MKKAVTITIIAVLAVLVLVAIFLVLTQKVNTTVSPEQEAQVSGVSVADMNSVGQDVNSVNDSDLSDTSLDSLG